MLKLARSHFRCGSCGRGGVGTHCGARRRLVLYSDVRLHYQGVKNHEKSLC